MVALNGVYKDYPIRGGQRTVLRDINCTIRPGDRVGILGRNGSGKSTLIRLISGAEHPTSGRVSRGMRVSWPLAFQGGFQGSLSGLDNLRFICRIYNQSVESAIGFVEDFSELGIYLREPVKSYSSGMRARLAFALSMVIDFDCYLIDEVIAVGDTRFQERCQLELFEKRRHKALIMVSHHPDYLRQRCNKAAVLLRGQLHTFDDIDAASEFYNEHSAEQ